MNKEETKAGNNEERIVLNATSSGLRVEIDPSAPGMCNALLNMGWAPPAKRVETGKPKGLVPLSRILSCLFNNFDSAENRLSNAVELVQEINDLHGQNIHMAANHKDQLDAITAAALGKVQPSTTKTAHSEALGHVIELRLQHDILRQRLDALQRDEPKCGEQIGGGGPDTTGKIDHGISAMHGDSRRRVVYEPYTGTRVGEPGVFYPDYFRAINPLVPWFYNPWTGERRGQHDIAADPLGECITAP